MMKKIIGRFGTYNNLIKNWYLIVLFNVLLLLILLGYRYYPMEVLSQLSSSTTTAADAFHITNSNNDTNMTSIHDQDPIAMYRSSIQDNDDYAVEAAMLQLFPSRASDIIRSVEDTRAQFFLFRPFWSWWHSQQTWKQHILSSNISDQHLPEDVVGTGSNPCGSPESLPLSLLRRIVATNLELPSTFNHGNPTRIKEPFLYITRVGTKHICVQAILPEPPVNTTFMMDHYLYQPANEQLSSTSSPWWDSIMVSALNIDTDASMPIHMEPWKGHALLRKEWMKHRGDKPHFMLELESMMHERRTIHVYEGSIKLLDPGRYHFDARIEYQEAKWNFEKGPIVPYRPQQIMHIYPEDYIDVPIQHSYEDNEKDDNEYSLLRHIVKQHMELPYCTRTDLSGRWLPSAVLSATEEPAALDIRNKFWAPYNCRLRRISYQDFGACLEKKYPHGIDAFGDSNTRRMIKKIITHGRWCDDWSFVANTFGKPNEQIGSARNDNHPPPKNQSTDPLNWDYIGDELQLRACYCEDYKEPGWNKEWFDVEKRKMLVWVGNQTNGVHLRSYKWDGLTYLNNPSWNTSFNQTAIRQHAPGDVAIVSIGNWDAAFMTVEQFQKELDELVDLIHRRYRYSTLVIYRTPQYYCCRVDATDRYRHISGQRVQLFDQLAREQFQQRIHNLMIWDTFTMGESRNWDEKQASNGCASNHVSADVVEVENQVLMNALCNAK
ncbi:hypothetical protein BDA99DRAFT_559325 [Phascolomyces articulosus]|uniref:Uncharacterized protein n=1 Tax=Phascolomyces articulosus TaxID=60185 RepID=A0AAD5KC79_9FUNG|nr:hypothetical protein BDA99DRAFT_559325 [Phascolomyces articulosus]